MTSTKKKAPTKARTGQERSPIGATLVSNAKLFISHAASDGSLVRAFVDLLEGGIGVAPRNIFCSSLKGQGIQPGADFKSSIRDQLDEASCVIALISPNFYGSAFCMCELGGVWLQAKNFIPVLVPPLEFSDLKAVLAGLQAGKLSEEADLDELRDEISKRLELTPLPTPRWNQRRDDFLKSLPGIRKKLLDTASVPRATHDKVVKELKDYKAEYKLKEAEVDKLKAINADLLKIKDPKKAASAIRKHSTEIDAFQSLVMAAKQALRPLPRSVRETIYYNVRGEEYFPKEREDWDDVQHSIECGQLTPNDNEKGVKVSDNDPKVKKAVEAVRELSKWLREPRADFSEWHEVEHDGIIPDLKLRPFWDTHLW